MDMIFLKIVILLPSIDKRWLIFLFPFIFIFFHFKKNELHKVVFFFIRILRIASSDTRIILSILIHSIPHKQNKKIWKRFRPGCGWNWKYHVFRLVNSREEIKSLENKSMPFFLFWKWTNHHTVYRSKKLFYSCDTVMHIAFYISKKKKKMVDVLPSQTLLNFLFLCK